MKLKKLALAVAAVMAAGSVFIGCNNMNNPKAYEKTKLSVEKAKVQQYYENTALATYYSLIDSIHNSINNGSIDAEGKLTASNEVKAKQIELTVANANLALEREAKKAYGVTPKKITYKKTSDIAENAYKGKTKAEVKMDLEKNWFELK